MSRRPLVAVVGGGISGLAAAQRLTRLPGSPRVVLLEAGDRLGGLLRSTEVGGVTIDAGADSLLARVPWGRELLDDLDLLGSAVTPAQIDAHVWARGRLRPLPTGLMTGRARAAAIRRSGLLTRRGQVRASLDLVLPGRPAGEDESVADALGARLGSEVVAAIAEPMVGGVYAGSARRISSQAVMPALAAARAEGGSLIRALRAGATAPTDDGPAFVSLPGGLARLAEVLADTLIAAGVEIRLSVEVTSLAGGRGGTTLSLSDGEKLTPDAVVLALPAGVSAELLKRSAPAAAAELGAISHASVAIAAFAFSPSDLPALPASSGFLVAADQALTIKACTITSNKWPQLAPNGPALMRCSLGRAGSPPVGDDSELLEIARRDLSTTLNIDAQPLDARVSRFDNALPQLEVGHLARVSRIETEVTTALPQVAMTGAWMRGIGVAACIREGRKAAETAMMIASNSERGT